MPPVHPDDTRIPKDGPRDEEAAVAGVVAPSGFDARCRAGPTFGHDEGRPDVWRPRRLTSASKRDQREQSCRVEAHASF